MPGQHLPEEVALSPALAPMHAAWHGCFAHCVSGPKFPQTQRDRPLETSELGLHGRGGGGTPVLKEDTAPCGLNVAAPPLPALLWSPSSWWEPPSIETPTAHGTPSPGLHGCCLHSFMHPFIHRATIQCAAVQMPVPWETEAMQAQPVLE